VRAVELNRVAAEFHRRYVASGDPDKASEQAVEDICDVAGSTESTSRQGAAEGHSRARSRARGRAGHRRECSGAGGWGSPPIKGSTRCKAAYRCTSANGVVHGRAAGHRVSRPR
jgi:hypothetical protein